jgi:anaerobic carbon-monoxide dehydrogenase iron sulfur subunit
MGKYIESNPDKCTACRLCEVYCSLHHHGEISPAKSRIRIRIFTKGFYYLPNVCRHCTKAPCAESCPTKAISRNRATGAVEIAAEECIGCKECVTACPFGAMGFSEEDETAFNCDLCGGDPQCVKHCYYGALSFAEPGRVVEAIGNNYALSRLRKHLEGGK